MSSPEPRDVSVTLAELPMPDLSPNAYLGLHHYARKDVRITQAGVWLSALREALGAPPHPRFECPVSITIHVQGTGNRTDVPNWVAHVGWKVLIDCLTDRKGRKNYGLGLLPDDSMRYVRGITVTVEPGGEPATTLTITPLEGA